MGNALSDSDDSVDEEMHTPNMCDVVILSRNIRNSPQSVLPTVLLLEILSYGYCPLIVKSVVKDAVFRGGGNQNQIYLALTLSPSYQRQLTFIEFEIESKDQGWSSYPADQGSRTSNTWGEVSLSCSPDERHHVYRNIHAGKNFESQTVVFDADHDLCKAVHQHAARGESVDLQLWLRSMYPGWQQTVRLARMTVKWHFTEWQKLACENNNR